MSSSVEDMANPDGPPPTSDFPLSKDEPDIQANLSGRNFCKGVDLNRWDGESPISWPELEDSLLRVGRQRLEDVADEEKKERIQKRMEDVHTLEELSKKASSSLRDTILGLKLTVLAKRKIDTVVRNGYVTLYGDLLVGDETGFCILKCWNDVIELLYNRAEIGDSLYIPGACYKQTSSRYQMPLPFNSKKCLNLELKIRPLQTKVIFFLNEQEKRVPLHDYLFDIPPPPSPPPEEENVQPPPPPEEDLQPPQAKIPKIRAKLWSIEEICKKGKIVWPSHVQELDLIGIVVHVGRIERAKRYTSEIKERGDSKLVPFTQYNCFRWITLVGKEGKSTPVSLRLFLNSENWRKQSNLTPKTLVVLTHVRTSEEDFGFSPHLTSTQFTALYINREVFRVYKQLMPSNSDFSTPLNLYRDEYEILGIITRNDLKWSAGGSIESLILDEGRFFKDLASEELKKLTVQIKYKPPLARREVQRVLLVGNLLKYTLINGSDAWTGGGVVAETLESSKFNWYAFGRVLPRAKDLYSIRRYVNTRPWYYTDRWAPILSRLLMPAEVESTGVKLEDCGVVEKAYYEVEVYHKTEKIVYKGIWKGRSLDEMKRRLREVRDKVVVALVDFHCVEIVNKDERVVEIIFQDIIQAPDEKYTIPPAYTDSGQAQEMLIEEGERLLKS